MQLNFVGLRHDVDGKVWTKSVGTQDIFRLDLATGKWERFHPTDFLPPKISRQHLPGDIGLLEQPVDGRIRGWPSRQDRCEDDASDVVSVPTPHARARRMEIDDQDRILVTEYRANKVALFDTKTEKFTEYDLPPCTYPVPGQFRQERRTLGLHHELRPRRTA